MQARLAGVSGVPVRARLRIARGSRHLARQARVRSPGIPKAALPALRPRTERAETTGHRASVAARPRVRVTAPAGRRARREDPGQAVRAAAPGPRPVPVRTVNPVARPRPHRDTGRDGPRSAGTHVVAPGLGADRAGPPMAAAPAAGEQPPRVRTMPRRGPAHAGRASQARRGPAPAATGATAATGVRAATGAQVRQERGLRGHVLLRRVRSARARARLEARVRPGAVLRDPTPAARPTVRPAVRAA